MSVADQLAGAVVGGDAILEASLGRVWRHHGKGGFAILAGWRSQFTDEANQERVADLKRRLRALGFGFVPGIGVGQDMASGRLVPTPPELVVLVPRPSGHDQADFRAAMLGLGCHFDQVGIVVHDASTGSDIVAPCTGKIITHHKTFSAQKMGEYFTALVKRHRQAKAWQRAKGGQIEPVPGYLALESLAWWGIKYPSPPGAMEAVARQGELWEWHETTEEWLADMGIAPRVVTEVQLHWLDALARAGDRYLSRDPMHRQVATLIRVGLVERTGRHGGTLGRTALGRAVTAT